MDCKALTSFEIPACNTEVAEGLFKGCTQLAGVTFPQNITAIGENAFNGCSALDNVAVPGTVTSIGSFAFADCTSLTTISLPEENCDTGERAFKGCTSLESITLPGGTLGAYVLAGCTSLKTLTVGEGVTSIPDYEFSELPMVSVYLPRTLGKVGYNVFQNCTQLKTVDMPSASGTIACFDGCSSLESIVLPEGVTKIGYRYDHDWWIFHTHEQQYAFRGCTSLQSVTMPDTVQEIEVQSFAGCTSLTEITLSNNLEHIGEEAFRDSGLTFVIFPETMTNIETKAFYNCQNLTWISFRQSECSIGESAFEDCRNLATIYFARNKLSLGNRAFYNVNTTVDGTQQPVTYYTCYASYSDLLSNVEHSYQLPDCGDVITSNHSQLVYVAGYKHTTREDGLKEHYACTKCGATFSDAEGNQEVSPDSLVIPKINNFFTRLRDFFEKVIKILRRLFGKK